MCLYPAAEFRGIFLHPGDVFSDPGGRIPNHGQASPVLGEGFPDVGERIIHVGELFPDVGDRVPEQGDFVPDLGGGFPGMKKKKKALFSILLFLQRFVIIIGFQIDGSRPKKRVDMAQITTADVEKVASLAKLEFSKEEMGKFAGQFSRIIGFVEKIGELDTGNMRPMTHAVEKQNVVRKDEVIPSMPNDEIMSIAPKSMDGSIVVPKVIEY